jgi:hypothetical protein
MFLCKSDHLSDFAWFSHICGRIDCCNAELLLYRRSRFLNVGRRTDAVEHDVRTRGCELLRAREANSAR